MQQASLLERIRTGGIRARRGFTLVELLIVLAIIALLLTLAVPRYFQGIERSKDAVLLENLRITREVVDKFFGDNGRYPESLGELVEKQYLRSVPLDPITNSTRTWVIIPPQPPYKGNVFDIKSGARGATKDGKPYSSL